MQIKNHSLDKNLNSLTQKLLFYDSKCSDSCQQLLQCGFKKSGRYVRAPSRNYRKEVYCDQTTDGGCWILILRNKYGNITFNKNWDKCRNGFGDLDYNFWLGNDFLYKATSLLNLHKRRTWQLYVKITNKSSASFYAKYENFIVLSEAFKYQLHFSNYLHGTAGDSLSPHSNVKFSTKDQDNDMRSDMKCATNTARKVSKYGLEITPYLDTFEAV